MDVRQRASAIRLIAFDIDGVMTDGGLTYNDAGVEAKTFNVQDGLGIKFAQRAGIEVAIVTGRTSGVVAARARDLGVEHLFQGVADKGEVLQQLLARLGLEAKEAAFMGDDLIDLPAMRRVGFAIAPANARPVVKENAHYTTVAAGGHGAVREVIEFILESQDKFAPILASYLNI